VKESTIINWDNVFKQSDAFKQNKPFQFGFIENFFDKIFYDNLHESYPKLDDSWTSVSDHSKFQLARFWGNYKDGQIMETHQDDPSYGKYWNKFKRYAHSDEFIQNIAKFSGVKVTRLKYFQFMAYKKGGFQLPHIHNVGPSTLILMIYFSKNWQKGDPGGTYMASDLDESKIIFEPYNLDNSMALFHDSPKAAHGVRYITKDVTRKALQITLEGYSEKEGWSGGNNKKFLEERKKNTKRL